MSPYIESFNNYCVSEVIELKEEEEKKTNTSELKVLIVSSTRSRQENYPIACVTLDELRNTSKQWLDFEYVMKKKKMASSLDSIS
jgi:hypothetical protein